MRPDKGQVALFIALAVAGALFAFGLATALESEPTRVITIPPETTYTSHPPAPRVDTFGDGRHLVLDDIAAGTYRTGGSSTPDWPMCTWKLIVGDRINASGTATGPVEIVVQPQHTAVESNGCMVWQRVGELP